MLVKGRLAEIMVQVDPELYRKYVIHNSKGQDLLYVKMNQALFDLLKSALQFYTKIVVDL